MAIYTQSSIFSEYHSFPSSGSDRNFVGTRVHDNVTTIYLVNEGDADILLRFYRKDTAAFDLNTVVDTTFKIPANSVKTLNVGTGTSSPGARLPLYSIVTAGNTTDLYVSYVCRCVP